MAKSIRELLTADHERLDRWLDEATANPGGIDPQAFDRFRRGLLRHIGLEEKIFWPAAREAYGAQIPQFERLRADHGRLVASLVPSPTRALVEQIRAVLMPHNQIEDAEGGIYEWCERVVGDRAADILARLREAPEVPVRPHMDRRPPPSHS